MRSIRLATVLLAGLALPVLASAQTTAPTPARPTAPPPAAVTRPVTPAAPAPSAPAAAPRAAAPATAPASPVATGRKIDINGATEQELAALPGIGPVTAKNIVQGRPWDDMADLVKKKAMAQATFDKNKDRFALANINTSSVSDMSKTLAGIGDARARKIVDGRPYTKPDDLVGKNVLTQAQFDKIKDVITY